MWDGCHFSVGVWRQSLGGGSATRGNLECPRGARIPLNGYSDIEAVIGDRTWYPNIVNLQECDLLIFNRRQCLYRSIKMKKAPEV